MLKKTAYAHGSNSVKRGFVHYLLVNSRTCVFSGITSCREVPSTVNAADCIVQAISDAEGLAPNEVEFYDLLTATGYPMLRNSQYEFQKLAVLWNTGGPTVTSWTGAPCPPDILRSFGLLRN